MAKVTRRKLMFTKEASVVAEPDADLSAGFSAKEIESKHWLPDRWDKETDVVVIGFGAAGAAAAIEAADTGVDVLVLEKMRKPGGAIRMSGGVVYAAGTSVQRAVGIEDTPDEMYKYYMATDMGLKDPALVRVLADESAKVIEWLIEMGADFPPEDLYVSGAEREYTHITPPKPRAHHFRAQSEKTRATGPELFGVLEKAIKSRKIEVMLETSAKELLTNIKKEVVGVKVWAAGKTLYVRARRGVVLADGGFDRNLDMLKNFSSIAPYIATGKLILGDHPGHTGDCIKMAMAIGADLCDVQYPVIVPLPFVQVGEINVIFPAPRYPSIYVNRMGLRFVNEDRNLLAVGSVIGDQDFVVFQIFDNEVMEKLRLSEQQLNLLVSAPTIRELATKLGISPERLEDTIKTWNRYTDSEEDLEFGKMGATVGSIKTPPFWGGAIHSRYFHFGGLKINTNAQVIDVLHGRPIPKLYAAGQTTGGFIGSLDPGSGVAIAYCLVFGRIAGKNAAMVG